MHKGIRIAGIILLAAVALFMACKNEPTPPPATTGTISGTVTLQVGMAGDLNNIRVAIYASWDDWNNDRVIKYVAGTGSASNVSFTITNVVPGTYYLDAWKDMDNSGTWSIGDMFGVYGTTQYPNPTLSPLSVIAGQTTSITVTAIVL